MCGRCGGDVGDVGEMWRRSGGDMGRCGRGVGALVVELVTAREGDQVVAWRGGRVRVRARVRVRVFRLKSC